MGVCNCSMFCCTLLYVHSSIVIILMGKRELVALLNLSSWCLVMVERLFLGVPWGCLWFVNMNVNETEFHINGYGMFNTVISAEEGLGIIIYVRSDITKPNLFDFHLIEATGIKIKLRNCECLFFLIAVYRCLNCHVDCFGKLEKT